MCGRSPLSLVDQLGASRAFVQTLLSARFRCKWHRQTVALTKNAQTIKQVSTMKLLSHTPATLLLYSANASSKRSRGVLSPGTL